MTEQSGLFQPDLRGALELAGLSSLADSLIDATQHVYQTNPHGDWSKWLETSDRLDAISASSHDFNRPAIRFGIPQDCNGEARSNLKQQLRQLNPWRKGPFELFGVMIDSEWRSNLKWDRLTGRICSLHGRSVLDVGCGNGYYLWRMLGQGAAIALGIDPTQLFIAQFNALKRYCPEYPAFVLPLKSEQFLIGHDERWTGFDTVFSMGILYHRRKPIEHLQELVNFVRPGGELIIETLVVDGNKDAILVPGGRYAKMRNVWSIPSVLALDAWIQQSGLVDIELIDVSKTTADEQRQTEWMEFESLANFLDPVDRNRTIEGHPAPQRAIMLCRRPD